MIISLSAACRYVSQDFLCSKPLACFGAAPRPCVTRAAQLTVSTTPLTIFATYFHGLHVYSQRCQYLYEFGCGSLPMIPKRHVSACGTPTALYKQLRFYQIATLLQPMASTTRQRCVYLVQVPSHRPYAKFLALPCPYSFALCEQLPLQAV